MKLTYAGALLNGIVSAELLDLWKNAGGKRGDPMGARKVSFASLSLAVVSAIGIACFGIWPITTSEVPDGMNLLTWVPVGLSLVFFIMWLNERCADLVFLFDCNQLARHIHLPGQCPLAEMKKEVKAQLETAAVNLFSADSEDRFGSNVKYWDKWFRNKHRVFSRFQGLVHTNPSTYYEEARKRFRRKGELLAQTLSPENE